MVRRWVGAGMLEAERSFRRFKGCANMPTLVTALRADVARRVGADNLADWEWCVHDRSGGYRA